MMNYYDKIKDIRQTVLDNASIDDVNFGMYKNVIFNYFYEILKKVNIIFDKKVIQEKEILLTKKFMKNDSNLFIKTNFSNERPKIKGDYLR